MKIPGLDPGSRRRWVAAERRSWFGVDFGGPRPWRDSEEETDGLDRPGRNLREGGPYRELPRRSPVLLAALASIVLAAACSSGPAGPEPSYVASQPFFPSQGCGGCHVRTGEQHSRSKHSESWTNPMVQAQFYNEYLDQFHNDLSGFRAEPACMSCHAPMAYLQSGFLGAKETSQTVGEKQPCDRCHRDAGQAAASGGAPVAADAKMPGSGGWRLTLVNPESRELARSGVGCDFCHTVTGPWGPEIGGGRYMSRPGPTKYGPLPYEDGKWHRAYSEFHTKSEFCALCHQANNRFGIDIRSTYSEWKESPQAAKGVQCQDCHMSAGGFLDGGRPSFERGKAATLTFKDTPEREKLSTHRFVGAHSARQVTGAVTLELALPEGGATPGGEVTIGVTVDNSRTGHRFPTGSPELRSLWLDVVAEIGRQVIRARVDDDSDSYGLAGRNAHDQEVFGAGIPEGARVYRSVFAGSDELETLSFYNAKQRLFDNRLGPGEKRRESFRLRLPAGVAGDATIRATLTYRRYPDGFARRLGQKPVRPVVVATAKGRLTVTK